MIRADHRRWARFLYERWIERQLRRHFGHFFLVSPVPDIPPDTGLLITPNHMSWWDGFLIDYLCRAVFQRTFHIMMLENQLRRYWFFQKLGAFSINPHDPASVNETIAYTADILSSHDNLAVLFPQGILEPYDRRPFNLKRKGLESIAAAATRPLRIIPLGLKISFFSEQRPDIFVRFGEALKHESIRTDFNTFEHSFIDNINQLDKASYERTYVADLFS